MAISSTHLKMLSCLDVLEQGPELAASRLRHETLWVPPHTHPNPSPYRGILPNPAVRPYPWPVGSVVLFSAKHEHCVGKTAVKFGRPGGRFCPERQKCATLALRAARENRMPAPCTGRYIEF